VYIGDIEKFSKEKGGLHKKFKLDGSIATSNMTLFNMNSMICRYKSPFQVLQDFFEVRLMMMFTWIDYKKVVTDQINRIS
jgi:hypothetical protein